MTEPRIIYNVTIKVENSVAKEWLEWMQKIHIPEVMATDKFESYQINKILHEDPEGITYAIQYTSKDMTTFMSYNDKHAKALQAKHTEKFKDRYIAIRTLMEIVEAQ